MHRAAELNAKLGEAQELYAQAARGAVATSASERSAAFPNLARRFAALAGNPENALALTLALRNGERVTLVQDDGGAANVDHPDLSGSQCCS